MRETGAPVRERLQALPLEVDEKRGLEDQDSFHLSEGGRSEAFASSIRSSVSSEK